MGDIDELQRRLSAAMDRVARALERAPEPVPTQDSTMDLQAALDEERLANAQLHERIKALKARAAEPSSDPKLEARLADLDRHVQQLRHTSDDLRASNAALRAANTQGVGDADLINASLQAELDALRAARAVDVAEAQVILTALAPLLEQEQEDAPHA